MHTHSTVLASAYKIREQRKVMEPYLVSGEAVSFVNIVFS